MGPDLHGHTPAEWALLCSMHLSVTEASWATSLNRLQSHKNLPDKRYLLPSQARDGAIYPKSLKFLGAFLSHTQVFLPLPNKLQPSRKAAGERSFCVGPWSSGPE